MTMPFSLTGTMEFAAKHVTRRYRDWVDYEDVLAEIQLYAYDKADRQLAKWIAADERFRVTRALIGAGKAYAAREKAARCGYEYDDIAWYTGAAVAALVPLATDPLFDGQLRDERKAGSKPDPAEGNSLLASVMDVRLGIDKFGAMPGDPDSAEYAEACDRIAEWLGGESPDSAAPHLGARKAMSNATARVITSRQEGT